jgi:hypothetical protein
VTSKKKKKNVSPLKINTENQRWLSMDYTVLNPRR